MSAVTRAHFKMLHKGLNSFYTPGFTEKLKQASVFPKSVHGLAPREMLSKVSGRVRRMRTVCVKPSGFYRRQGLFI